jgi:hypothetical protein
MVWCPAAVKVALVSGNLHRTTDVADAALV